MIDIMTAATDDAGMEYVKTYDGGKGKLVMQSNTSYDSLFFQHAHMESVSQASHHPPFHPFDESEPHMIHQTFLHAFGFYFYKNLPLTDVTSQSNREDTITSVCNVKNGVCMI